MDAISPRCNKDFYFLFCFVIQLCMMYVIDVLSAKGMWQSNVNFLFGGSNALIFGNSIDNLIMSMDVCYSVNMCLKI